MIRYTFSQALDQCRIRIMDLRQGAGATLIAVAGGSGAGKSFFATELAAVAGASILSMDNYYRGVPYVTDDNFDCPASVDLPLLKKHLQALAGGGEIERPCYDFAKSVRTGYEPFRSIGVVIVDGLFTWTPPLDDAFDLKVFVEADEGIRLARRLKRDAAERKIPEDEVLARWRATVVPMYRQWVAPLVRSADLAAVNNTPAG